MKARSLAMLFDVTVLLVVFILVNLAGTALDQEQLPGPGQAARRPHRPGRSCPEGDGQGRQRAGQGGRSALQGEEERSSADVSDAQDKVDTAKANAKAADKKSPTSRMLSPAGEQAATTEPGDHRHRVPPRLAVPVPCRRAAARRSARSCARCGSCGSTVRPQGSSASLAHYAVPIGITLALLGILGPIAAILGFGTALDHPGQEPARRQRQAGQDVRRRSLSHPEHRRLRHRDRRDRRERR